MKKSKQGTIVKRVIASLIDISFFLIVTMVLFSYICNPLANKIANLNEKQVEYYEIGEDYNVFLWDEKLQSYVTNKEATAEENKSFLEDEKIVVLEKEISKIILVELIVSSTVSAITLYLLIPLLNKRNKTIGKYVLGFKIVDYEGNAPKKLQIALREVSFIVIELFMGILTYGVTPLISLALVMFNDNGLAIHDYISKTKVVRNEEVVEEVINEEEDEYYKSLMEEEPRDLRVGGKKNEQ